MRPVIMGMNNPRSVDPDHALWPYPNGCTGYRLWQMLNQSTGASVERYLLAFDRRNLLPKKRWLRIEARMEAGRILMGVDLMGREVLVLGDEVRRAFDLPKKRVGEAVEMYNSTWWQVPHPSGLCRFYNDPRNKSAVASVLKELYDRSTYGRLLR